MGRYKKRKLVYFNIDYIKAFIGDEFKKKEEKILFSLSKNSNQYFIKINGEDFSITKIENGKYRYLFSINYGNISVGFFGFYAKNAKNMIEITGQGLTLFGVSIFYDIMKYFGFQFEKYKRVDICFDLDLDINYFYEKILDEKYKKRDENGEFIHSFQPIFSKKNGLETMYFGKKNIKENSYMLNRIYNKILDSKKKNKLFLYEEDYKKDDGFYKNITRFETEIREDLCKFYDYKSLKDEKFLFYRIVKSFYKYNTQFFKFLKDEDFFDQLKKFKKQKKTFKEMIKIGNIENLKPASQSEARLLKIKEAEIKQIKYGRDIIDEEELEQSIKMFTSYGLKLMKYGKNLDELMEILKNFSNIDK